MPSNLTKGSGSALSALLFGNWSDLLIGEWGAIDLLVDPYTNADSGQVRVVAFSFVDIAVRHAQSFAAVSDIVSNRPASSPCLGTDGPVTLRLQRNAMA